MKAISMLIKPASVGCNMNCSYCFYRDVSKNRDTFSYGLMSLDTLEILVKKVFSVSFESVVLAFQGGEPTLRGLDFYKALIKYVETYNTNKIHVSYAIQTNGYALDDKWAEFLADNNFFGRYIFGRHERNT